MMSVPAKCNADTTRVLRISILCLWEVLEKAFQDKWYNDETLWQG